jgi:hypothetical protein
MNLAPVHIFCSDLFRSSEVEARNARAVAADGSHRTSLLDYFFISVMMVVVMIVSLLPKQS